MKASLRMRVRRRLEGAQCIAAEAWAEGEGEATIDPAGAWLNAHPKEVARYQELGGVLAVHGTLGIVAHGKTLTDARVKVDALGLTDTERDEVVFSPASW